MLGKDLENSQVQDRSASISAHTPQNIKRAEIALRCSPFECEQTSDNDLGGVEPKEVLIRGVFYGKVNA